MEKISIKIDKEVLKRLRLFKITHELKSISEVIALAMNAMEACNDK